MRGTLTISILWALLCFIFSTGYSQQVSSKDIFADVPEKNRERLKERLQTLISFQQMSNYEKIYELMSEDVKKTGSKESFVKTHKEYDETFERDGLRILLLKFSPKDVYSLYQDYYWMINGCGEYLDSKKKKYYESQVEAVYEDGDWYFRSLIGVSVGFGTPLKKCKMPKGKK